MTEIKHSPFSLRCSCCGKLEVFETVKHKNMKAIIARFNNDHKNCEQKKKQQEEKVFSDWFKGDIKAQDISKALNL